MQRKTILFDLNHNEMLNIDEKDFSDFLALIQNLNLKIKRIENKDLTKKVLEDIDILVIGNPIDDYFSSIEVKEILDYVRVGGHLILISEYGGDALQKTNLNDLTRNFGIQFEKNLIKAKSSSTTNTSNIIHIQNFPNKNLLNGLREVIIGGTCSLLLSKGAKPFLQTESNGVWSEMYNITTGEWIKDKEQQHILAAGTEFGQGKIIALGDVDLFSKDNNFGINSMDNQKFIQNLFNWLLEPVKRPDVMTFILEQMGNIQNSIKEFHITINNIIETMSILEKRISFLEEKTKQV
jgi:hypothetical protein